MRSRIVFAAVVTAAFLSYSLFIVPQPRPLRFSGAMRSLQFWNAQRAYPGTAIDDRRYEAAFVQERALRSRQRSLGAADQWRAIGPHNIGGRTLSIAVNPWNTRTIFAGSASGGLWRSFNEGKGANGWERITTGFPVQAVGAIAIAPGDTNVMLIGTGEVYNQTSSIGGLSIRTTRGSYGIGILRTSNGGATWTKVLDWQKKELRGVQAVKFHPVYMKYVWAATTEGIFKSVDTGRTWTLSTDTPMGTDLVLDPNDTLAVLAAHGNLGSVGGGIYKTENGGKDWYQMTAGLPSSYGGKALFSQYRSSPNVVFASIGNGAESGTWLCKSLDFGSSWTIVNTDDYATYQGWYSHFVAVDPIDSSKVLCGGVDIFKSVNGGNSLTKKSDWSAWYFGTPLPGAPEGPSYYSHADHHAVVQDPLDHAKLFFGNDGGVFCTTDGGDTFEGRNGGYQTTQFYNGFSSHRLDSSLAIGGLQDNATAIYEGTVAWRRVIGGDGCMTAMSPTNKDTLYGEYQSLSLLRSTNKGASFANIPVPSSTTTSFVGPFALSETHPKIMYAGRDKVFKSTNAGSAWSVTNGGVTLNGDPALALAIAPTNPDTVYVTTAPVLKPAALFVTTNGGTSWMNITGTLPDRYLIDIAVDQRNGAVVYVTASGFGTSHLFRSTNAGKTWSDIGVGLPDVPTSAVAVDPFAPNHLYVGNDLGVYLSTNSGTSWNLFSDGLTDAALVMDLSVSRLNRSIRAVTHGNGVFERRLYSSLTSVRPTERMVTDFRLEQNYPNPFNPTTAVSYQLSAAGMVKLSITDALGRKVAHLVNAAQEVGTYNVTWDASGFASGTYFARLESNGRTLTRKMLLVK